MPLRPDHWSMHGCPQSEPGMVCGRRRKISDLRVWWEKLSTIGRYFVNPSKTWLVTSSLQGCSVTRMSTSRPKEDRLPHRNTSRALPVKEVETLGEIASPWHMHGHVFQDQPQPYNSRYNLNKLLPKLLGRNAPQRIGEVSLPARVGVWTYLRCLAHSTKTRWR